VSRDRIRNQQQQVKGGELTKGRNVQLPAVHVYSQRGARGVRGARSAVFRDIALSKTKMFIFQSLSTYDGSGKCVYDIRI